MARTIFILGGGAALGAHQVGALRYLDAQGIRPDAIVGSSIGVVNGCLYASGGVENVERAWLDFPRMTQVTLLSTSADRSRKLITMGYRDAKRELVRRQRTLAQRSVEAEELEAEPAFRHEVA